MSHLTRDQLSALLDGALGERARADAERHLETCASCREALAELSAGDEALRMALDHDPGDAYFEAFPERLARRMAEARRGGTAVAPGWRAWFTPARVAWAASAAALLIAGGIVFLQSGDGGRPMERSDLITRAQQQERIPPAASPAPSAMSAPSEAAPEAASDQAIPPSALESAPMASSPAAPHAAALRDAAPPAGSNLPRASRSIARDELSSATGGEAKPSAKREFAPAPSAAALEPSPPAAPSAAALRQSAERRGLREDSAPMAKASAPQADAAKEPQADAAKERAFDGKAKTQASDDGAQPRAAAGATGGLMNELRQLKARIARPLERDSGMTVGRATGLATAPQAAGGDAKWRTESKAADDGWTAAAHPYVQAADSLDRLAGERESAEAYDAAAGTWAAARSLVATGSRADAELRVREADSRWAAYGLRPTIARTRAAHDAVNRALAVLGDDPRAARFRGYRDRLR